MRTRSPKNAQHYIIGLKTVFLEEKNIDIMIHH